VLLEEPGAGAISQYIANVEICSYVDAETGDHTAQPAASFTRGDTVWLYLELRGPTVRGHDDKFEVWVKVSELSLFGPEGTLENYRVDSAEVHETALEEAPTYVWLFAYARTAAEVAVGQYRWEFVVTDELSGATATGAASFTLK
jgi:hypothetical protein